MDESTKTLPRPEDREFPETVRETLPKSLGRFQRLRLLGTGGMGEVYEAHDPHLDRMVAVKLLKKVNPETVRRFVREARAQARVDHSGICRIYEVGEAEGEPYIVMQLIKGRSLDDIAKDLNLEQKLLIMTEVAAAVHEAHRSGLIHRDIKPNNIMVEETDDGALRPYVLDFGIARVLDDPGLTATGSFVGTLAYSAPEQIQGKTAAVDRRTDVYALGATLYSILSGKAPFAGSTPSNNVFRILSVDPEPLTSLGIPHDVQTIVLKCLEKESSNRYGSAHELGDDLQRFLDGEPISASPPGFVGRLRRKIRKNRTAWIIGTCAAVLLMCTLGWAGLIRWQANVRERLVRDLTAEVVAIESTARLSHMSPQHDIRPDRKRIQASLEDMARQIGDAGDIAAGPGSYALARGHLAMGDPEQARLFLERAWASGFRTPEVSHALGVAMSLMYRERLAEIELVADPELRTRMKEAAHNELQQPAMHHMRTSLGYDPQQDSYLRALIAYHENDFATALGYLEAVRGRDPWRYEVLILKGDIFRQEALEHLDDGRQEEARQGFEYALEAYDAALQAAESDPSTHTSSGRVRLLMMEMDQFAGTDVGPWYRDGLRRAADAARILPSSVEPLLLEARLHFRMAEQLRQGHEDPTETLGLALDAAHKAAMITNDPSAAWRLVGRVHSSRAHWFGVKGDVERQEGALDDAVNALDQVGSSSRDYVYFNALGTVHSGRADLRARRGENVTEDYRLSMTAHRQALALHPSSKTTLTNLYGCMLRRSSLPDVDDRTGILEEAVTAFEQASEADASNPIPLYFLGRCYLALAQGGDPHSQRLGPEADLSLESYRRGQELNPELPHFYSGIGEVLLLEAQQEWDWGRSSGPLLNQADESFRRGLELSPRFIYLHLNLAWTTYFHGKYEVREGRDGREELERAAAQARKTLDISNNDNAVLCLGSVHRMLAEQDFLSGAKPQKHIDKARKRFAEILGRNPKNASARLAMGRLLTLEARLLSESGADALPMFDSARNEIALALAIKPEAPSFLLAEGRRCLRLAEWHHGRQEPVDAVATRGLDHIESALKTRPDWPEALALGACLRGLGAQGDAIDDAAQQLERALAVNPHLGFEFSQCLE